MGAGNSKKSQVDLHIDHPRFGQVKAVENGDNRVLRTTMGVDDKTYEIWAKQLTDVKLSPAHLLLPVKNSFSTKGLCGSSGTLTLDFEDYPYLLSEEIYHRHGQKSRFDQTELWFLLYNLVAAKRDFSPHSPKLGDIRPRNVFLNRLGDIKVSNLLSWPNEPTNDQKAYDKETTYLAPQEVAQMQMNNSVTETRALKEAEVFSIGLTVLSSAILQDLEKLYSFEKGTCTFHQTEFERRLFEFKCSKYSEIFRGVVSNLCQPDPNKRIHFDQLVSWIDSYKDRILAKQNFNIASCPQSFHNEVIQLRAVKGPAAKISTYPAEMMVEQGGTIKQELVQHNVVPIQSLTDTSQLPGFEQKIKQAESVYTPLPAQLSSQNNIAGNTDSLNKH